MSGSLRAWRPMLRFARRDARRHLARTILASLLVAVPIAGLVGFIGFSNSDAPSSERALASIPDGAQATLTATALPRGGAPFPQLPEGAPGPWMDDPETLAAGAEELAAHLPAGSRLLERWLSPELIVSTELGLAPGEQRAAADGADRLSAIDFERLATGSLEEAVPEALPLILPPLAEGEPPAAADEVAVSSALAERLGLALGDDVGFLAAPDTGWRSSEGNTAAAMQDSQRGYRVSAIVDDARLRAWAPAGWLSRLVEENPAGIQGHWLVVGDQPVTWEQAKALNALQAFAVSRHVLTHYPSADELYPVPVDVNAMVEAAVGIAIAGMLGAFLVFFLVTPAFAVSGEQLRRSLGLAAAAGAAPRDLRRAVLAQGVVIGAVGGIAGAVLGLAAAVGLTAWVEAATPSVNGTVALGAQVPVSADFDRLLLSGAVAAVAEEFPKIVGSEPVGSTAYASSFSLAPLLPAGVSCPPLHAVHLSSALSLGAPLRCTAEGSAAAFAGGLSFPSWLGSNTLLMSGDALRATRLPGAEEAAAVLERGGAVVGNAALLAADGGGGHRIRLAVGSEFLPTEADAERVVTVPGAFVRGLGGPLIVAPETAEALGVDAVDYLGEVLVASAPLSWGEALDLRAFVEERSPLPLVGLPDDPDPLGGALYWAPILLLALVAVLATAVAVLLSATQGRRDAATMHAVGADRRLLVRLGLAKAGVILAVGVPAGLVAGIGLGAYQVAWNRRLEASGAWLSTVPVWGAQLGIAAGVCAAGLLAALVLTRPPRHFERRGLD